MIPQKGTLLEFFSSYPLLTFDPGERFKRANEKGHFVRYIKSGYVKLHSYTNTGKEITLLYLGPKDYYNLFFGYSASLDKYYISAVTEVKLWSAPKSDVKEFLQAHPSMGALLVDSLLSVISKFSYQVELLNAGNSETQVAAFLVTMAKQFSYEPAKNEYVIKFPVTHQTIADYTGLTRETVSLQLIKFRNERLIDYNNANIKVLKLDSLKEKVAQVI